MHSVCGTQCACPTKSPKLLKKEFLLRQTVPDVLNSKKAPSLARFLLETFLVEMVLAFETQRKGDLGVADKGERRLPGHPAGAAAQVHEEWMPATEDIRKHAT
jgi:hypothetical protein